MWHTDVVTGVEVGDLVMAFIPVVDFRVIQRYIFSSYACQCCTGAGGASNAFAFIGRAYDIQALEH